MEASENLEQQPWWRFALNVLGGLLALAVLGGLVIGLIVFVAGLFGGEERARPPVFLDLRAPPPPPDNARTRSPPPYGSAPWPDHPGRVAWSRDGGGGGGGGGAGSGAASPGTSAAPTVTGPVGMSVEELRAAWQSGGRIVLPNPSGECDLGGQDAARSMEALEKCFAERAAR